MPSSLPDVSVVLPAFNAAPTIECAARSILNQTLRLLELIVIDDGSTDGTSDIVSSLSEEDSRVRLLLREHRGVCAAANAGTEAPWPVDIQTFAMSLPAPEHPPRKGRRPL